MPPTPEELNSSLYATLPSGAKQNNLTGEIVYPNRPATPAPVFRYTNPLSDSYEGLDRTAPTMDEEATVKEQARKDVQSYIDAVNVKYGQLASAERLAGEQRTGQTRAVSARSGILTSDFGVAHKQKTEDLNQRQLRNLEEQKAAETGIIFSRADERARSEIEAKRQEAAGNEEAYRTWLESVKDDARGDFKTLAESGTQLTPEQKEALSRQAGYEPEIGELLFNAYKKPTERVDYQYIERADGSILAIGQDPTTGSLVQQVIPGASPDIGLVIGMIAKYPDAGILVSDDLLAASQKIKNSGIYREQIRPPIGTGGDGIDSEVENYAQAVQGGSLKLTGVPIKLRAKVSARVEELKTEASEKYDTEIEARVDYDRDVQELQRAIEEGESLAAKPSEIVQQLVNDYGTKISKQEIEATIRSILGVTALETTMPLSANKNNAISDNFSFNNANSTPAIR